MPYNPPRYKARTRYKYATAEEAKAAQKLQTALFRKSAKGKSGRRRWKEAHIETAEEKITIALWREKPESREKIKAQGRRCAAKSSASLSDRYVRMQLTKNTPLRHSDIPQSLIDAKRLHLKVLRLLKENMNGR